MTPAVWPRGVRERARLLHVDPLHASVADRVIGDLPDLLRAGDLVVLNDAATLPASLQGQSRLGPVEARLAARAEGDRHWTAVLFGAGSWRQKTEDRPAPPRLEAGERIRFGAGLEAEITDVSPVSARLVGLRLEADGDRLWPALYRAGRPIQYAHLCAPLALWDVQTPYAARPWAVEMPSAGRALTLRLLETLSARGVAHAFLTHAAGLSSSGDDAIDAMLPLPERYEIPETTRAAIARTRSHGGRVVAVGTSAVRALEASARRNGGRVAAERAVAELIIDRGFAPRAVDGLLSGIHETGTSHRRLLEAFAPAELLDRAFAHAEARGYLGHEFGDLSLTLAKDVNPSLTRPGHWRASRRG